jgi:hypothetical protein
MLVTNNLGSRDQEDCGLRPAWSKKKARPYLKNTQYKKDWQSGLSGRVVKCLPSKCEALSLNPSISKKTTKE